MENKTNHEKFMLLFSQSQANLSRYIFSLCHNMQDCQDILQETTLSLWRKFDQYNSDQPFLNWAFRFAYYEVMKFREKQKKAHTLCETTLKILAEEYAENMDVLNAQKRILQTCVGKLAPRERELVELRYGQKLTVTKINEMFSESGKKIYRAFERIRHKLYECVDITLNEEGWK
ncbi:MAG: sigma-70 family RNA polymerase sigma factor [Lentisphaeraceae bacterium]|nr:sigma-70 family RNA polymerase sigma factor [Lentisphaeraceae bacterium]